MAKNELGNNLLQAISLPYMKSKYLGSLRRGRRKEQFVVLKSVARGERSKEIAVQLGISERTVKAHLASIYNKLGVDSRAAAIVIATQRGLLGK